MSDDLNDVSMGRYLVIFTITYVIVSIAASIVLQFLEIERNIGVGIGILLGSAFFVANKFVADNNRVPSKNEKRKLVAGSLVTIVVVSIIGIYVISLIENIPFGDLIAVFSEISGTFIAVGAAVILGINWLILNFAYGFGAKKIAESLKS